MASAKDSFLNFLLCTIKRVHTLSCGLTMVILADEKMLLVVEELVVVHCVAASPAPSCRTGRQMPSELRARGGNTDELR